MRQPAERHSINAVKFNSEIQSVSVSSRAHPQQQIPPPRPPYSSVESKKSPLSRARIISDRE